MHLNLLINGDFFIFDREEGSFTLKALRLNIGRYKYDLLACAIIIFSVLLRLFLIAHNWPVTNSEEGTMGLEALNIAYYGDHPIYLYGQHYMGVGEAYLGAGLFHLFDTSLFSLRLGMLSLFTVFLVAVYLLGKLLYNRLIAIVTLLILVGGSNVILSPELMAVGGAAETIACGTVVVLLAAWLALRNTGDIQPARRQRWKTWIAYGGWGLATGLGLWSHLLVMPFIFCSALLLILFCWRDLRTKAGIFVVLGLLTGSLPLIIYNSISPANENTIAVFLQLHQTVYPNAPTGLLLWLKQLSGTFFDSLPTATGVPQLGDLDVGLLPFYGPFKQASLLPVLFYGSWSLGYLSLLVYATWSAAKSIYYTRYKIDKPLSIEQKPQVTVQVLRLALLATAWLTILSFATSATAAERPWSFRYLIGLMVAIPALLAPLLDRQNQVETRPHRRIAYLTYLKNGILILILLACVIGTTQSLLAYPQGNARIVQQQRLIQKLAQMHIDRVYSGYWVCDDLVFQSQKKIICAVLDEHLKPGLTRYNPDRDTVDHTTRVAYVFTQNGDFSLTRTITNLLKSRIHSYSVQQSDGYIVVYASKNRN